MITAHQYRLNHYLRKQKWSIYSLCCFSLTLFLLSTPTVTTYHLTPGSLQIPPNSLSASTTPCNPIHAPSPRAEAPSLRRCIGRPLHAAYKPTNSWRKYEVEGTSCSQTEGQALGTCHVTRAMDEGPAYSVLALAFFKYPQAAGPSVV